MATIALPTAVGVNIVGARPVKPHIFTPGLAGRVSPLSFGETFLAGTVELIDLSQILEGELSRVLAFVTELDGPINDFELPLPELIAPWVGERGAASGTASAGDTGEVTVSMPNPPPRVGQWVRIGDRVVTITGRVGSVLTVRPRLEFAAGVSVQWGVHSVVAIMEGEPSNMVLDTRTGFVSRVSFNWREKV